MKNTTTVAETSMPNGIAKDNDLYQQVINKIITLIEQGVAPWRRTWSTYGLARNYVTRHIYTGINLILMNNTSHAVPYFMTWKQVKEQGGSIKKGAKAEMVIYFSMFYKDCYDHTLEKEEALNRRTAGEEVQVLKFIRHYNVFNIADIEGIDFQSSNAELLPKERIECCEKILWHMPKLPKIISNEGSDPFYSPVHDFINVPDIANFQSSEAYYATLFHELIHATGHESRLNREEVMNPIRFGTDPYSREEIVAEMGASYLCSTAGIDYDSITENSASYLAGWLKILKKDSKFIFKAAAEAQKAADYILNRRQATVQDN